VVTTKRKLMVIPFLKYGFRMKEQNVTAGLKGSKPTNATPDCSLAKCAPESLRSLLTLVTVPSCPIAASGPDVHAQLSSERADLIHWIRIFQ
jgi:hypothetical protein